MASSTQRRASTDTNGAADESMVPSSSFGLRASDSAVLSHYPTPLLRLLVLLSPVVNSSVRFIHLATWTGGPGTASHSFMLVLAWWAICLYGYEVVRYCPQLALLTVLGCTGIAAAFRSSQGRPVKPAVHQTAALASSDSLNATIDNLALLADFTSTLYSTLIAPLISLFLWHDVSQTLGLAVFLITSWPAWLLLFSGTLAQVWDLLGMPAIAGALYEESIELIGWFEPHVRSYLNPLFANARIRFPAVYAQADQMHALTAKVYGYASLYVLPHVYATISFLSHHIPDALRSAPGPHIGFFPILSLRVRHLLLVLGTIAFTWCSPWFALIRHALWQSALVRRTTRFTWACLSGQIFFARGSSSSLQGVGRLTLGPNGEPVALGGPEALFEAGKAVDRQTGATKDAAGGNVTRHEDVVYQFTIFENQRWWMGLDWTAALLPQERPSWADESNNPVSPPSSFSLPPPKTTLKHTPKTSDPKSYTKRLIRWQWIDPEWTVAGRDTSANGGTRGARRASTTSAVSAASGASDGNGAARGASDLGTDPSWLDVDAEGWQYGDNSWDKMSKKAGMGRYTRRRRWIRRAVLVELVQADYHPTSKELTGETVEVNEATSSADEKANSKIEAPPSAASSALDEHRSLNESSLRERLARAAAGGSSVGTAQGVEGTKKLTSPGTENGSDPTKI